MGLERHMETDLLIIGGGINGAGIARDAAGRGLRVVLVEQGDLGSGTSSASSKLIHGGLRYLEQLQFRLVTEALREREAGTVGSPMSPPPGQASTRDRTDASCDPQERRGRLRA